MVDKKRINEQLSFLTERLSTQTRTISFGLIIVIWGLLVSDSTYSITVPKKQLIIIGTFSLIAMFLDFFQYFSGFLFYNNYCKRMEKDGSKECEINKNSLLFKMREICFWFKQVFIMISVMWFIILIFTNIV